MHHEAWITELKAAGLFEHLRDRGWGDIFCGDGSIDSDHENCDDNNDVTEVCATEIPVVRSAMVCQLAAGATSFAVMAQRRQTMKSVMMGIRTCSLYLRPDVLHRMMPLVKVAGATLCGDGVINADDKSRDPINTDGRLSLWRSELHGLHELVFEWTGYCPLLRHSVTDTNMAKPVTMKFH